MITTIQNMTTEALLTKASSGQLDDKEAYYVAMELDQRFPSPTNTAYNFPKTMGNFRLLATVGKR